MSPKKLSESEQQELLEIYRQPGETMASAAERFGVSSSTASRVLRRLLTPEEYDALVQEKKRPTKGASEMEAEDNLDSSPPLPSSSPVPSPPVSPSNRPIRKRSIPTEPVSDERQLDLLDSGAPAVGDRSPSLDTPTYYSKPRFAETSDRFSDGTSNHLDELDESEALGNLDSLEEEDLDDGDLDDGDLDDLDADLDEDFGDEDYDEEDDDEDFDGTEFSLSAPIQIQVLPLTEALLPRPCYLVIDRASELITRPLRDFGELGSIPAGEAQVRILPIFDNHRSASRFSRRNQRVIKVPDGQMLCKTCSYLESKGIGRLLINGQLYSLSSP